MVKPTGIYVHGGHLRNAGLRDLENAPTSIKEQVKMVKNRNTYLVGYRLGGFLQNGSVLGTVDGTVNENINVAIRFVIELESGPFSLVKLRK